MIKKENLFNLVAELVNMLMEHGANENGSVENALKYYGFTEKQIKKWYGLGVSNEDTDNE